MQMYSLRTLPFVKKKINKKIPIKNIQIRRPAGNAKLWKLIGSESERKSPRWGDPRGAASDPPEVENSKSHG